MTNLNRDIINREFLGQGWAFPLQFDARGNIALAKGIEDIEQSIRIILETMPGERVMRPEFGCQVKELLFSPRNAATETALISYVDEALARWEPRISVFSIEVRDDSANDGAWIVEINFTVKDTHDERSIVYPFFIEGEEE